MKNRLPRKTKNLYPSNYNMPTAFNRLSPNIQKQLYKMNWTQLRGIQVKAINAVMDGKKNIIISARTAGGKTEAAFLPIISKISDNLEEKGIQALYIGPLKALINDQFRRLEELCELSDIPVHKWHGDVGQEKKKNLIKQPSGILLITPESLESLFINRSSQLNDLFKNLSSIVIDEMHAFMNTERGIHLQSLLSRVLRITKKDVVKIGLSATFGEDIYSPSAWLTADSPENVEIIKGSDAKNIQLLLKGYLKPLDDKESEESEGDLFTKKSQDLAEDIIAKFYGKTALIFADNKTRLEDYADFTARLLERKKAPNLFRIHHGSLSRIERESTEEALKSNMPAATFCSSTLELGIDVGNVELVGQIGCPWSVSSLAQRIGRSGRRDGTSSTLIAFVEENTPKDKSNITANLFPELLQTIAAFELMLEGWYEPLSSNKMNLSTMMHQIMSVIAEKGGINTKELFNIIIEKGAFRHIDKSVFLDVLKSLGREDIIEQTPEGDLILGLKGEKTVRFYDFYSAFKVPEEMNVIHNGRSIGKVSINAALNVGSFLVLAAKRWEIVEIYPEQKELLVEPARGRNLLRYESELGSDVHENIRHKMKEILISGHIPAYLDTKAKEMLSEARCLAKELNIADNTFITNGADVILFTWTSSKINTTLWGLAKYYTYFEDAENVGIGIIFKNTNSEEIKKRFESLIANPPSGLELASKFPIKPEEKYTRFLSENLKILEFANNFIDVDNTLDLINILINE